MKFVNKLRKLFRMKWSREHDVEAVLRDVLRNAAYGLPAYGTGYGIWTYVKTNMLTNMPETLAKMITTGMDNYVIPGGGIVLGGYLAYRGVSTYLYIRKLKKRIKNEK